MSLHHDKIVIKYGEKGHLEYGWSNNTRERILQLNFQLVRTNSNTIYQLQNIYHQLINDLMNDKSISKEFSEKGYSNLNIRKYKIRNESFQI